ncbi:hypothetical protein [Pseudoflavonifractor sp. An85]|uniref:hypothetical protein n=1 Tax=Pseudoflavonifractor sp. An85 TaxID=1965661 RepID=UPI000B38C568|nr:hypothetical protein [Pseudoflavonifractor sp. An85]OUN24566.1 hypothetical protein B5G37_07190 [Pseudoflavonifractor sp. An85]
MKTKLSMAIRAGTKGGSAVLSLMGDDIAAVMDTLHDVAVKVGQWADLPPASVLLTVATLLTVEEYQARKAAESLGGREEKSGDQETSQADLPAGQGVAHNAGEGAGEADKGLREERN